MDSHVFGRSCGIKVTMWSPPHLLIKIGTLPSHLTLWLSVLQRDSWVLQAVLRWSANVLGQKQQTDTHGEKFEVKGSIRLLFSRSSEGNSSSWLFSASSGYWQPCDLICGFFTRSGLLQHVMVPRSETSCSPPLPCEDLAWDSKACASSGFKAAATLGECHPT